MAIVTRVAFQAFHREGVARSVTRDQDLAVVHF